MTDRRVVAGLAPTGVLRAAINLGNPVLAHGPPDAPGGVTVDLAQELAQRLGVEAELVCCEAARTSFRMLTEGEVDIAFLAIEPAREARVAFTDPYLEIEGVYVVPVGSDLRRADDVDRPGVRIGVKEGSAYDLYLTRTLTAASIVRGADGVDAFREQRLEVAAGIREPMAEHVAADPGLRLLEPRFMAIRQAVATGRDRDAATLGWLRETVAELAGRAS